jgi:hypothetical protein
MCGLSGGKRRSREPRDLCRFHYSFGIQVLAAETVRDCVPFEAAADFPAFRMMRDTGTSVLGFVSGRTQADGISGTERQTRAAGVWVKEMRQSESGTRSVSAPKKGKRSDSKGQNTSHA